MQLRLAPVGNVLGMRIGRGQAQLEEIEGGAEPRMRQQPEHALAHALRETRLQQPDFLHRQREPARQGGAPDLVQGDPVGRATLGIRGVHALRLQQRQRPAIGGPQQHRIEKCGRHRLIGGDARVGIAQALHQHPAQRAGLVRGQCLRGFRQQCRQQAMRFQQFETGHRMAGQEQFQGFLEQPRRRGLGQQGRQPGDRFGGRGLDGETQLGRQACRAQHAHRVFAIARFRIADQAQQPRLHIVVAADVVAYREILDRVIQRIRGEVAADRIVLDRAVDVVAQQAATLVLFAVAAAVIAVGAEGGDLDDLAAIHDMGQAEAAADQPAVAEQRLDLLRRGVGGHVVILRRTADQQVAHGAAYQVATEAGLAQAVEHAQCVLAHLLARQAVLVAGDHAQAGDGIDSLGFDFGHALRRCRALEWDGLRCRRHRSRIY